MKTELEYKLGIKDNDKALCEKYWLRESDKRSGFIYSCKELGQEFDLQHQDIQ